MDDRSLDYRVRTAAHKTASDAAATAHSAIADFLQLLGRAARQFHTYPAASPLTREAVDACQRAFAAIEPGPPLLCRVVPSGLIVNGLEIGRDSIVEQELARPLHRARVAALEIDRAASARDWTQFCSVLPQCLRPEASNTTLADLLSEAGVTAIIAQVTPRPEVLALGAPPAALRDLVARERSRHRSTPDGGPVQHLYPPAKGWVLLDPTVRYDSISLLDLTLLVNDPAELAAMLMRLTDDGAGTTRAAALEQKYPDVVMLISALEPRIARLLFTRLARAVLDLGSDRRKALLRRAILPGLLDGRVDAEAVLSEFPEVDLADALCLLLDLEAAAPQLLTAALDRLNLPAERREAVIPLIEERLRSRTAAPSSADARDSGLAEYAGALLRVASESGQSFGEFAAFDLAMTEQTTAALARVRDTIAVTDGIDARLACLAHLIGIEPNPAVVAGFLDHALTALQTLAHAGRWEQLSVWLARLRQIAAGLQPRRAEIAALIGEMLTRLCDRQVLLQLVDLSAADKAARRNARLIVAGLSRSMVPAWLAALQSATDRPRLGALSQIMAGHARELGPAIAKSLPRCGADAVPGAIRLLGFAGGGYEKVIADQLARGDESTFREALRALARIGTAQAVDIVIDQLEHGPAAASTPAEDALWRLPPAVAVGKARELLGRREFVTSRPQLAGRLLDRAVRTGEGADLGGVLAGLAGLRYHFWHPAVMRVGARARALMQAARAQSPREQHVSYVVE